MVPDTVLPEGTAPLGLKQINWEGFGLVMIFADRGGLSRLEVLYGPWSWNMSFFDTIFGNFSN